MKQMFIKVQIFAIVVMGFWSSLVLIDREWCTVRYDRAYEFMWVFGLARLIYSPGLTKNSPYPLLQGLIQKSITNYKEKYGRISHTWPASHHALFLAVRVTSWEPQLVGWRAYRKPLDALLPLCPLTCP